MQTKTYQNWQLEEDNHILNLRLCRSEKMNNLTAETLFELKEISEYISTQTSIWAVVLSGEGIHFSAGVDVASIKPLMDSEPSVFEENLRDLQLCIDAFEAIPQPKIAKIQGYCIGGGLILACCCDFRIADESAQFCLPEVKMGIAVIMGTQRITRLVGIAVAKEMTLLGEFFDAKKAEKYGLLNALVHSEQLNNTVKTLADKFRHLPPPTIRIARKIIEEGTDLSPRESQELEIRLQSSLIGSTDWSEAVQSHFQKRKPNFKGE
jgi:enoyl-CoA hydratase/carnithine racemase